MSATARRIAGATALLLSLSAITAARAEDLTAEGVLARHAVARGGLEAWRALEALELSGTFTSFSREEAFRAVYHRDGRYRFDTTIQGREAAWGVDAEGPWWQRPLYGIEWPRRTAERDGARIAREGELAPPLLDFAARGHGVELLGPGEVDGIDTVDLKLTLASGLVEIWHLDAATYLEVAIDSQVYDYTQTGELIEQRAYFSDFRPVAGLLIPHRVEKEYKSRHTALVVASAAVRSAVPDAVFRMPLAEGMAPLQALAGSWRVTLERRGSPRAPWQTLELGSEITADLGGSLLTERWQEPGGLGEPVAVVRTWSWDRFSRRHRLTQVDEGDGQLRVFEGGWEEGRLAVSNLAAGPRQRSGEVEIVERWTLRGLSPEEPEVSSFQLERELSLDGGESFFLAAKYGYQR